MTSTWTERKKIKDKMNEQPLLLLVPFKKNRVFIFRYFPKFSQVAVANLALEQLATLPSFNVFVLIVTQKSLFLKRNNFSMFEVYIL